MNTHKHQCETTHPVQLQYLFSVCSFLQPQPCPAQPGCAELGALVQHSPCTDCTRDHSGQSLALPEGTSSPGSSTHANTNGKSDNRHNHQEKKPCFSWGKKNLKTLTGFYVCTSQNKTRCFFLPKRKDTKDEIITTGLWLFILPCATKPALKPRFRVPYTSHTHGTPPQTNSSALLHRRGSRPSYSAATMPAEKQEAGESPAGQNEPARHGELRSRFHRQPVLRPSLTWAGAAPRREELREPPHRRHRPRAPGPPPCSRGL